MKGKKVGPRRGSNPAPPKPRFRNFQSELSHAPEAERQIGNSGIDRARRAKQTYHS